MTLDLSTINREVFNTLPIYDVPPRYRLGSRGMGCFMDAPGYPTYFRQPVYNLAGNPPDNAPDSVLAIDGVVRVLAPAWTNTDTWESRQAASTALLHRLYVSLPVDHPRVRAWIRVLVGYFRNCYVDMRLPAETRRHVDKLYIPHSGDLPFAASSDQFVPRALVDVRDIYPDFPESALSAVVAGYGGPNGPGDWWERHSARPTVAECPGPFFGPHKTTGWCQFCGSVDNVLPEGK